MVKVPIGKIEKGLVDKTKQYKELTGIGTVELIENLLTDFFKDSLLTNDFITLEEPFYFNHVELLKKGVIEASVELPIHDLESCYIVKKVPNNLDNWNNENKSYSSGRNSSIHKGIYIDYNLICGVADSYEATNVYENVKAISEEFFVITYCYLFKLNTEVNELEISLVPFNNLFLYIPADSGIITKLEEEKDYFYNNILFEASVDKFNINFDLLAKKNEVLESFYNKKNTDKTSNLIEENFSINLK